MSKFTTILIFVLLVTLNNYNCYFVDRIGETSKWASYNVTKSVNIPAQNQVSQQNYGDYTELSNGSIVIGFQSYRKVDKYFEHNFVAFDKNGQLQLFKNMKADKEGVIALIHTNVENEVFYARQIENQSGESEVLFGFFNLEGQITRGAADASPISLDEGDRTYEPLVKRGNNLIYLLTYLYDDSVDSELLYLHIFDITKTDKYVIIYNHRLDEYKFNYYFAYTLTVYRDQKAVVQAYNNDDDGNAFWIRYAFNENGQKQHGYPKQIPHTGTFREEQSQNSRSYTYLHKLNNQTTTIFSDLDTEFVIQTLSEDGQQICENYYNLYNVDMSVLYYGLVDRSAGWIQTVNKSGKTIYYLFNPSTCDFDGESYMESLLYNSISGPYVDFKSRKVGIIEIGNNKDYQQQRVQILQHQIGDISQKLARSVLYGDQVSGYYLNFYLGLLTFIIFSII